MAETLEEISDAVRAFAAVSAGEADQSRAR